MTFRQPLRLGVLISGAGTGMQNLIDRIALDARRGLAAMKSPGDFVACQGLPGVSIAVVISSRSDVAGVERARAANLPVEIIRPLDHPDVESFSERIAKALVEHAIDLAVQAGWLCYWRLPPRWMGRVINIHPALLPKFGGKGFYGRHVHEAVLAAGERESGATVHWVDNEYDHGPIILQRTCPVLAGDTADTLAARVSGIELELLPEAIRAIAEPAGRREKPK